MPKSAHLQDELSERTRKSYLLMGIIGCAFFILICRLFYLQVIEAELNTRLSRENQMRLHVVKAPRGLIYDRNGIMLARNRPSYSICVFPYKMNKKVDVISRLLAIRDTLGEPVFDSLDLTARITRAKWRRFERSRLKEDVPMEIVSIIEEHGQELPGILVETESRREYPLGPKAFHVLGYMSEIAEDKSDSLLQYGYSYGDLMGKSGIEQEYEPILKGTDGREFIEVNAYGRNMGPVANTPRTEPNPGNDIYLSLDAKMQEIAHKAFNDTMRGAVVAIDPRNGEVLCLYSSPALDPNIFSLAASARSKSWGKAALDPRRPLNNRATTGVYPPGSTFKLVTALAAVASGKMQPEEHMPRACGGSYAFGSRIAHCWKPAGHGYTNVYEAIKMSCNVYFYQAGIKLGDKIINFYADKVGFGRPTGIDLPSERSGWLSGEAAYNERYSRKGWRWTPGLVLDLAIGQTQLVTPIQLAMMVGVLGTGNIAYTPHLMKEERDRSGTVINSFQPKENRRLGLAPDLKVMIHRGMAEVINEPGGTGGRARVPFIVVGGKTGSAQNPFSDKTHALFCATAPLDNPVIAIACVVEEAGHGGSIAAPIAGDILRYFFSRTPEGRMMTERSANALGQQPELAKLWAQVDSARNFERIMALPDSLRIREFAADSLKRIAVKMKADSLKTARLLAASSAATPGSPPPLPLPHSTPAALTPPRSSGGRP